MMMRAKAAEALRQVVRQPGFGEIRKVGLALSKYWPFPVPVRLSTSRTIYVDLRSGIGRSVYARGYFDPAVFDPLSGVLKAGDTFIDVGANIGYYSVLAAEPVGDGGAVYSYEVDPRPLRCLSRTLAGDAELRNRIRIRAVAAGQREGTGDLMLGADSGHTWVRGLGRGARTVTIVTLDAECARYKWQRVAGIKIDVEGAEMAVLRGAKRLLKEHRPLVVCEADAELLESTGASSSELLGFFDDLGYRVSFLDDAWSPTIVADWRVSR